MMHEIFIQRLKSLAPEIIGLRAMLLIGSCARGTHTANSDIDLQLLVNNLFDQAQLKQLLVRDFSTYSAIIRPCKIRGKLTIYFEEYPKIDFSIYTQVSDLDRNYIGSELKDLESSVLYVCPEEQVSITNHLQELINLGTPQTEQQKSEELIERFVYEYENASTMHKRSDAYQFYFFYNIALQCTVQLASIARKEMSFNFLPKKFLTQMRREEQKQFITLTGTLLLSDANTLKRRLLDYLYPLVKKLLPHRLEEIKELCEMIYRRDYFWNFRDLTRYIPSIAPQRIYRSSSLSLVREPENALELLNKHHVTTIIDLRALDKEGSGRQICFRPEEGDLYQPCLLEGRSYVLGDLDAWAQPQSFIESKYYRGSGFEIAYRFFVVGCKEQICRIMQAILEAQGAVLIHCFAGKDRTGIVAAMLELLAGASEQEVIQDYLASEVDTKVSSIRIVLDQIAEFGGIETYLSWCGLEESQIQKLKQKLSNG